MHTTRIIRLLAPAALLMFGSAAFARGTYQQPDEFVRAAFGGSAPPAQVLWLAAPVGAEAGRILGHPPAQRRVRYWQLGARSAWVLEDIGKEELITTGIVVDGARIALVKVYVLSTIFLRNFTWMDGHGESSSPTAEYPSEPS